MKKKRRIILYTIILLSIIFLTIVSIKYKKKSNKKEPEIAKVIKNKKTDEIKRPNLISKTQIAQLKNKDVIGWICIPDTTIDNPILQRKNDPQNNLYYFRRNSEGNYSFAGCLSTNNDTIMGKSQNFVIYGHNIQSRSDGRDTPDGKNGKIFFAQLYHFLDQGFAKKHPYIFIASKNKNYVYKVFAVFYTNIKFQYIETQYNTKKEFLSVIQKAKRKSIFNYPTKKFSNKSRILTLTTCTNKFGKYGTVGAKNHRFVVMAKQISSKTPLRKVVKITTNLNQEDPDQ